MMINNTKENRVKGIIKVFYNEDIDTQNMEKDYEEWLRDGGYDPEELIKKCSWDEFVEDWAWDIVTGDW